MNEIVETQQQIKKRALIGLAAALVIALGSWLFIRNATDRGLARLQLIDRVYAVCQADYAKALTSADTTRIDEQRLIAVIDSGSSNSPHRCGDLRRPEDAEAKKDSLRRVEENRRVIPTRTPR